MTVTEKRLSPQCREVVDYLREYGDITSRQAWGALHIARLGARIWDLRHKHGYHIDGKMIAVDNGLGGVSRVKQYFTDSRRLPWLHAR